MPPRPKKTLYTIRGGQPQPLASVDLSDELKDLYDAGFRDTLEEIKALRGLDDSAVREVPEAAAAYADERGGELITNIDETTREEVADMVARAQENGLSDTELADQLDDSFLFDEKRAQLIARTEGATAFNQGTIRALAAAGEDYVVVSDPCECGLPICDVDGEIWTLEEAEQEPIGHPNCGRDFRPLTEDELAEMRGEEADDLEDELAASAQFYSEDQPRDERGRWEGGGGSPTGVERKALESHLVDLKADRALSGPESKDITDLVRGTSRTSYLSVPGIDEMHDQMGLHPTMNTPPFEYQKARDALFEKLPLHPVAIKDLTFTQPRINTPRVNALAKLPAQLSKPVQVVMVDGRSYLMNGHHRVAAAHVAGMGHVTANVLKLAHAKFYSEDQPRGEDGKWTDGGGEADTGNGPTIGREGSGRDDEATWYSFGGAAGDGAVAHASVDARKVIEALQAAEEAATKATGFDLRSYTMRVKDGDSWRPAKGEERKGAEWRDKNGLKSPSLGWGEQTAVALPLFGDIKPAAGNMIVYRLGKEKTPGLKSSLSGTNAGNLAGVFYHMEEGKFQQGTHITAWEVAKPKSWGTYSRHTNYGAEEGAKFYSEDQERDEHGRWTSGGGSFEDFRQHATAGEMSRTIQGIYDKSTSPDKPTLKVTGDEMRELAASNYDAALRYAWDQRNNLDTPEAVHGFFVSMGERVTTGMIGGVWRQHEGEHYAPAADVQSQLKDLAAQIAARTSSKADPVETAAIFERSFSRIHPFADGVGRSQRAIAGSILAGAGLRLPNYPDRKDFYSRINKPEKEWTAYYRTLVPGKQKFWSEDQARGDNGRWISEGDASSLGGTTEKSFYRDAKTGERHLFKPDNEKKVLAAVAASQIAHIANPSAREAQVVTIGGHTGLMQQFIPGEPLDHAALSKEDVHALQREHVIDWATSQHDSHPGQFIRDEKGAIVSLDKSQAWKHLGEDKLSEGYHPNAAYGERPPLYNTLFRPGSAALAHVDPEAIRGTLDALKGISHDQLKQILGPYARVSGRGDTFIKQAHERLQNASAHFSDHYTRLLGRQVKFYSEDQLRDERGRWTEGGGSSEHGRAWDGKQVVTKTKLSKDATGKVGQQVVLDYLHENGLIDARPMNDEKNNYAIDMVQDHGAIEIKCGQVSNGQSAQQWRATIGEPPPRTKEWLKTATGVQVKAFHAAEAQAILDRKEAARAKLEKELGRPVKAWTYAVIVNPDKGTADIFKFKGYHLRIGWNTPQAKAGYVTTVKYGKH